MQRTGSPAHPIQPGYQLEDNPYYHQQGFDIPAGPGRYSPGDALNIHTPVSIAGNVQAMSMRELDTNALSSNRLREWAATMPQASTIPPNTP